MKVTAVLVALFVAGLTTSLALAKTPKPPKPGTTGQTTTSTTTSKAPKCEKVELKGSATSGTITFTVTKANKRGRSMVGSAGTLVVPAGAKVKAKVCSAAGGALTLRDLHVKVARAKP